NFWTGAFLVPSLLYWFAQYESHGQEEHRSGGTGTAPRYRAAFARTVEKQLDGGRLFSLDAFCSRLLSRHQQDRRGDGAARGFHQDRPRCRAVGALLSRAGTDRHRRAALRGRAETLQRGAGAGAEEAQDSLRP